MLHLLLGWLAAQVALGTGSGQASQSGALAEVAAQPFGQLLLWVVAAGFALLALWQVTEAFAGDGAGDRAKAAGKAVLYAALASTAATFATGGHSSSKGQTRDATASLLDLPGGQLLVAGLGLAVVAVAGYHCWKGWTARFLRDLEEHPGHVAEVAGRVGYVAKGVALAAVGVLFVVAAVQHRSGAAGGLDSGLRSLRDLPLGQVVLLGVALGLAAYGLYGFARARHART